MTDLVPVRVPCPSGQHPDGDSVSLRPKIGLVGGVEAQQLIQSLAEGTSSEAVVGLLMSVYLRHGIAEWTLHDEAGEPIPLTPANLQARLLDDFEVAKPIANEADSLYSPAVVTPLVVKASRLSKAMRSAGSTSAPTASPASRRKRSKRSSTSTTPTVVTETTSP